MQNLYFLCEDKKTVSIHTAFLKNLNIVNNVGKKWQKFHTKCAFKDTFKIFSNTRHKVPKRTISRRKGLVIQLFF